MRIKKTISVLICLVLAFSLVQTAIANTTIVPIGDIEVRVPLNAATTRGNIAGVQFAVSCPSGLAFLNFEPSQALASAAETPLVNRDGKTYLGFFAGENSIAPVDNTIFLGFLVFAYTGNAPLTFEITELKLVRLIDIVTTNSENFNGPFVYNIQRAGVVNPPPPTNSPPPPTNSPPPTNPPPTNPPPNNPGNGNNDPGGGQTVMQIGDTAVPLAEFRPGTFAPFIRGYADGTIRPGGTLTRAELAQIFYNLYADGATNFSASYTDVPSEHWAYTAVAFCQARGYMLGYPDGRFLPNQALTRAELSTAIVRIKDLTSARDNPFSDVGSHWARASIDAIFSAGHITGYPDGTFRPNNNVNRAEAAAIIIRAEGRNANQFDTARTFTDLANPEFWAYGSLMNAANGFNYNGNG